MNAWDNHPLVLEANLPWKDLSEEEQKVFIEGLKAQNLTTFIQNCDVVLPSLFTISFPVYLVNPNAPPEGVGQVRIFVEPRIQTPITIENEVRGASATE